MNEGPNQRNQRDDRFLQFKMGSHEAEHGADSNGREGDKRKMASIHGITVQKDQNVTDSFNENIYDDEPEVMEIEVEEALRHMSNRKSAGCDGGTAVPIYILKAGGEEAVKFMTGLCNCIIWKRGEWPTDWKKSVYVPIYKT